MPKSTGRVGVCLVTSGPGATNIITGLADAHYDSIPLVCFTGQVPLGLIGNDAFQEVDIVGMTRSITKYGVTVRRREDLGKIIKMAFYIAQTGKQDGTDRYSKGYSDGIRVGRVSFPCGYPGDISRFTGYISDS